VPANVPNHKTKRTPCPKKRKCYDLWRWYLSVCHRCCCCCCSSAPVLHSYARLTTAVRYSYTATSYQLSGPCTPDRLLTSPPPVYRRFTAALWTGGVPSMLKEIQSCIGFTRSSAVAVIADRTAGVTSRPAVRKRTYEKAALEKQTRK